MTNTGLSDLSIRLLDRLTDAAPSVVPKIFQRALLGILGRKPVYQWFLRRYRKQWKAIRNPSKILLIVDVNIGDAVLGAQCLTLLREIHLDAEVHFACNKVGGELLLGMPGITVHNIFRGGERGMPSEEDLALLHALLVREQFSVVFNMCPFIPSKSLAKSTSRLIQLYVPFAAYVFRAWKVNERRHVSYLSRTFLLEFLQYDRMDSQRKQGSSGLNTNAVYLGTDAIEGARHFLQSHGLSAGSGLVFFHPDATSKYGLVPFEVQSRLLRHALENEDITAVLLGKPFSYENLDEQLVQSVPPALRWKLVVVPHVPLGVYVALMDACDMFVAGDTGPLHIAACRKVSSDGREVLRNQTAVLAIYGATDSRMYGYDSEAAHHVPANQDVVSRSFSGATPCRNITCINKYGKFCKEVRCFDRLPDSDIEAHIDRHFRQLAAQRPVTISLSPERAFAL